MPTPDDFAADVLGCTRETVEPGRTSSGERYCGEHYYGWLTTVDMCPVQERLAKAIRARDAEVRDKTLAGFEREDTEPFHGHGFTDPGYWRLVGPKHYKPLPEPPTAAEVRAIRERFGAEQEDEP